MMKIKWVDKFMIEEVLILGRNPTVNIANDSKTKFTIFTRHVEYYWPAIKRKTTKKRPTRSVKGQNLSIVLFPIMH